MVSNEKKFKPWASLCKKGFLWLIFILTMSFIFDILKFWHLGSHCPCWRVCLPSISQFSEIVNKNVNVLFKYKPSDPEPTLQLPLSALILWVPLYPQGPGTRQSAMVSVLQSLLKLFKLSNLKPAYLALPIFSHKNYKKSSWQQSLSLFLCLVTDLPAFLYAPHHHHSTACPPPSWELWVITIFLMSMTFWSFDLAIPQIFY